MTAVGPATAEGARSLARGFVSAGTWVRALALNPVLVRDARSAAGGRRFFLAQLGYLAILAIAMAAAGLLYYQSHLAYGGRIARAGSLPEYGRWMFVGIFETQVVVLLLIIAAYSAGSISLEREKQTYDMLALSALTSAEVVLGKVAHVTLLSLLLLFTSVPLAGICALFPGVPLGEIALSYGLLALKLPLWAALGVLTSILTLRTIPAYVVSLVAVGCEMLLASWLSSPVFGSDVSVGFFNPVLAPYAGEIDCRFLGAPIAAWLLPIPYNLLLTGLAVVGAAEAMEHYRPKRSAWLRGLLLVETFFLAFLMMGLWQTGAAGRHLYSASLPRSSEPAIIAALALAWLWACAFVPVFASYPPRGAARGGLLRGVASGVSVRDWFARDARAGPVFCVCLWAAGILGVFLPLGLASAIPRTSWTGIWPAVLTGPTWSLALALIVYALSIAAYASWGAALAAIVRARREAALATLMMMLVLNLFGLMYWVGYGVVRRVPRHPALVLASPPAAASALMTTHARSSTWRHYGATEAALFGLSYPALLWVSAYWCLSRRGLSASASEDGNRERLALAGEEQQSP